MTLVGRLRRAREALALAVGSETVFDELTETMEAAAAMTEALLLLAITHFDHERLLRNENLDATELFDRGLLEQRELGQTGEYEACLTAKGFDFLTSFLGVLDLSPEPASAVEPEPPPEGVPLDKTATPIHYEGDTGSV